MVMIRKPVQATPELLRALSCSSRNLLSDPGHVLSFFLAAQFFAAHVPASYRAHTFLSYDHLVATRKLF